MYLTQDLTPRRVHFYRLPAVCLGAESGRTPEWPGLRISKWLAELAWLCTVLPFFFLFKSSLIPSVGSQLLIFLIEVFRIKKSNRCSPVEAAGVTARPSSVPLPLSATGEACGSCHGATSATTARGRPLVAASIRTTTITPAPSPQSAAGPSATAAATSHCRDHLAAVTVVVSVFAVLHPTAATVGGHCGIGLSFSTSSAVSVLRAVTQSIKKGDDVKHGR